MLEHRIPVMLHFSIGSDSKAVDFFLLLWSFMAHSKNKCVCMISVVLFIVHVVKRLNFTGNCLFIFPYCLILKSSSTRLCLTHFALQVTNITNLSRCSGGQGYCMHKGHAGRIMYALYQETPCLPLFECNIASSLRRGTALAAKVFGKCLNSFLSMRTVRC